MEAGFGAGGDGGGEVANSRFPEGTTERKARARTTATARANTGVSPLRFASVEMTKVYVAGAKAKSPEQ